MSTINNNNRKNNNNNTTTTTTTTSIRNNTRYTIEEKAIGEDTIGEDTNGEDTNGGNTNGGNTNGENANGENTNGENANEENTNGETPVGEDTNGETPVRGEKIGEDTIGETPAGEGAIGEMADQNAAHTLQAILANMRPAPKRSTPDQSPTSSATPNTPTSPKSPATSAPTRARSPLALFSRNRSTLQKKGSATSLKSSPSEPEYSNNIQPYFDAAPNHPTTPFELLRKNNPERKKGKKPSMTSLKSIISEPEMSPPETQCYDTVVARPRNPSPVSLEWRKRLIEGHVAYGEQTELFAPSGLESIFPQAPPRDAVEPSTGAEEFEGYTSIIRGGEAHSAISEPANLADESQQADSSICGPSYDGEAAEGSIISAASIPSEESQQADSGISGLTDLENFSRVYLPSQARVNKKTEDHWPSEDLLTGTPPCTPPLNGRRSITTHDFMSEAQMVMEHIRAGTMPQMEELDEEDDAQVAESFERSPFSPSVTSSDQYRRQSEDLTELIYGGEDGYQVADSHAGAFSLEPEPSQHYSQPDDRITEALCGGHVDDDQVAESHSGPFSLEIERPQRYSQSEDKITELIYRGGDDYRVAESRGGPFLPTYEPSQLCSQPADRITEALLGGHSADGRVAESLMGPFSPTAAAELSEQYSESAEGFTGEIYDGNVAGNRVAESQIGPFSPTAAAEPCEQYSQPAEGFAEQMCDGSFAPDRVVESHGGSSSRNVPAGLSGQYQQPLEGVTELLYGSQLPEPSLRDDTDPNKIQDLPIITIPRVRPMEPRYDGEPPEPSLRDDTDPNKIQVLPTISIPRVRPTAQELSLRRQTLMRRFTASAFDASPYEQSDLSMVAALPGDRMLSLSMSVSRPAQTRYRSGTIIDIDATPPWSDLSDFTIDQIDEDRPSERALAQRLASYAAAEVNDRYATATNELVKALTDVVGAKLFWNDIDELELQNQSLTSLYGLDGFCAAVTTLNVNGNPLTQLQGVPRATRTLWAQSCKLTSLTTWSHLCNLQHLYIENNELDSLSGLSGLMHLRDLRASGNQITSLDGLQGLRGLQMLDLSRNRLEVVDLTGYSLFSLEKVDLKDNAIRRVMNLAKLVALTELHLSRNPLEKSPSLAGNAQRLKKLTMNDCQLKELVVSALTGITHLSVDGNKLADIRGIEHLKKLEFLSMRRQKLPVYEAVNLFNHRLEARTVRLDGNTLPILPLKHNYLNMEELSLTSCGIQELPKDFGLRLPNLRRLDVDRNMLREKDLAVLGNMERLDTLSVKENRLGRMRKTVEELSKVKGLRFVNTEGNPFNKGFFGEMGALEEWAMRRRAYEVYLKEKCPGIVNVNMLDDEEREELARKLRELGVL